LFSGVLTPVRSTVPDRLGRNVRQHEKQKFFCFFFSKKEDASFSEEKEAKRLLFLSPLRSAWLNTRRCR
jgi:hypothetical protein